jgi:Ca2+-binding RTX toxin-like protein
MVEEYLASQRGISGMDLITIRIFMLFALVSILFLASFYHIASAETIMCKKDTNDTKSCKGSVRTDVLIGNKNSNKMNGLQGTDYIIGLFGNDYLIGYNGTDTLVGGAGNDVMHGGGEKDALMGSTGNDNITGGYGADEVMGGEGNDTILGGNGPDTIIAGQGDDFIVGGPGIDEISAGADDDKIYTANRNTTESDTAKDIVYCGEGNDEVWMNTDMDEDEVSKDCEILHKG